MLAARIEPGEGDVSDEKGLLPPGVAKLGPGVEELPARAAAEMVVALGGIALEFGDVLQAYLNHQ